MIALVLSVLALGVTALNLLLCYGIIRRLRAEPAPGPGVLPSTGHTVTGLRVGVPVALPAGSPTLVGFFSPGCDACEDLLPAFTRAAEAHPGGTGKVTAVVVEVDQDGDGRSYADALSPVAEVLRVPPASPWVTAFGVTGFPQVHALTEDGALRWSALGPADLERRLAG
ncbi:TlpA family protein disulfide reductase [Streptomyces harbinensis]|uniref:TlpA family protein disulfide reductase n=1 Tax=Streptomyces harbinensis TaxID=1176198 RepID=UPI0034DFD1F6